MSDEQFQAWGVDDAIDDDTEAGVRAVVLTDTLATRVGQAIVNMAAGDRVDDYLEPWDRSAIPSGAWLLAARDALIAPMAASAGHKTTIRAARLLMAEVDRLRAYMVTPRRPTVEDARRQGERMVHCKACDQYIVYVDADTLTCEAPGMPGRVDKFVTCPCGAHRVIAISPRLDEPR